MIQEEKKSEGEGSESKPILNGKIQSEISVIAPPATSAEASSSSTSSNKNHSVTVDSDIRTEPAMNNIQSIAVEDIPVVVSTKVTSVHAVLVPQQASRVVPVYQQTSQRAAQIKYLREILSTDKSMFDTGRAIDIVSNHPIVFQIPGSTGGEGMNPHFTAKQLVALLQARRKIDEVIHHVLGTL